MLSECDVGSSPACSANSEHGRGIMEVNKNGFLICPKCGKKTNTKVAPTTVLKDFPLYCNRCREAFLISYKARA